MQSCWSLYVDWENMSAIFHLMLFMQVFTQTEVKFVLLNELQNTDCISQYR